MGYRRHQELDNIAKSAADILKLIENYEGGIFRQDVMVSGISSSIETLRSNLMDLCEKEDNWEAEWDLK